MAEVCSGLAVTRLVLATAKNLLDSLEESKDWGVVWKDELEKSSVPCLRAPRLAKTWPLLETLGDNRQRSPGIR